MRKREALRAKYLKTLSLEDKGNYKKVRNKVKQDMRNAKIRFTHRKFEKCENNAKATWGVLRSLNVANKVKPSDLVVSVEELNVHYASVASVKNPALINNSIDKYREATIERDIDDKFFFKHVLPVDISIAINSIKSNAIGVDKIPVKFLKLCLPCLMPVLDHIFNYSLQNSAFPSVWKKANILPLPKIKNPNEAKDYRPVSNLCVLGKALEKIVHKQVAEFLENNKLFDKFQSGFRKNHSTVTALLKVTDDIRAAMDKRLLTLQVLLDLSKAFDCVHHGLLLAKLKYFGFSDSAIGWFFSYLTGRSHRVFLSSELFSEWIDIVTGVPQGSVLGPLLFLIYISDLSRAIAHSLYHVYADDIQLYLHFSLSDFVTFLRLMVLDVIQVNEFCLSHNLTLNVAKTQVIIFGTQRYLTQLNNLNLPSFTVNGCVIPYSNMVNNLGVLFDPSLSWNNHCSAMAQKIFGILAQLRRNLTFIPQKVRKMLVYTLAFPHLDYASVLFTDMSATNNIKIQRLQNACIRFISGTKIYDHISPIYKDLNILKVVERRDLAVSMLVWKIIKTHQPLYLSQNYVSTSTLNQRFTRSSKQMFVVPNHRLTKYNNSFHVKSINLWNEYQLYNVLHLTYATVKNFVFRDLMSGM
jgi:hypothetical protein